MVVDKDLQFLAQIASDFIASLPPSCRQAMTEKAQKSINALNEKIKAQEDGS
jgi:hypothetical protein